MKFDPIAYALHYGGSCRDCADADGVCSSSGMPCDPVEAANAAQHCLKAWQYGIEHGYMENPFLPSTQQKTATLTADQLCRTPLIEDLVPTSEEWDACEALQDRNDLIKRRVRLAFARATTEGSADDR